MANLRFTTAGESHGPGLVAVARGPAGRPRGDSARTSTRTSRAASSGHGRGGRMKIESDRAQVWGGIRHGRTLGSPVALLIENRDHANWADRMSPWPVEADIEEVHLPRPGHADLAGVLKFGHTDVRNVLERASARETAARVAVGRAREGVPARARRERPQPRRAHRRRDRAGRRARRARRTSRAWTSRPCAASTRTRARRWSPRSIARGRRTRASAACSRCAPTAFRPGSARPSPGTSASTRASRSR